MSGALRWSAVVVMMAAAALCGATSQDIQLRRGQMGQTMDVAAQGAGVRPGMRLYRGLQVLGEDGRLMTREERRRLRVERRQARKERRRQKHDGRREEAEAVADEPEEVVDLVWLRANLSSLWEEFRAFTRLQDRPLDGRGNSQRGYTNPPEEVQVPLCTPEVDGCRDSEDGEICSNHGTCHCGHCQCQSEYYGRTCQCSDHTCQLYDGMPCGGHSRGQCRCGKCMCRPDHGGEDCSCPTHTHACISPGDNTVCSNKGVCECGRCRCGDGYKGMYCEDSVYAARVCETLKACVLCKAWGRELAKCEQCQITISIVDMLEPSMTTCVMVNSGCILKYSYVPQAANVYSVLLERNNECPSIIE
ncbi:integrin beta-7-like [Portunus trituberculatus]|nr:integrin beta-7-like [Portunus trituberculatus]